MPDVMYVVAVSGGVDSVVLLDIMARRLAGQGGGLLVAHYDHGIRPDSAADREFVAGLARTYGLPFAYDEGRLGAKASEASAREARYRFLRQLKADHQARAIVTAHHEDDALETAILNLLRGTGRKGLSSLATTDELYRPLLTTPKQHIRAYAYRHSLEWRDDSTNSDTEYLRNYVRLRILPRFDDEARQRLRSIVHQARQHNQLIDHLLAEQLRGQASDNELDRHWFVMLPHAVAREVMAAWLRSAGIAGFDRRAIERLVVAAKTYAAGKTADIDGRSKLRVGKEVLKLEIVGTHRG